MHRLLVISALLQCLSRAGALRGGNPVRVNPIVDDKAGSGLPGTKAFQDKPATLPADGHEAKIGYHDKKDVTTFPIVDGGKTYYATCNEKARWNPTWHCHSIPGYWLHCEEACKKLGISSDPFEGGERMGSSPAKCAYTTKEGYTYDLSALSRSPSAKDWDVEFPKSHFRLVVNVCANTMKVPKQCAKLANSNPAVAYQTTTNRKDCFRLGDVTDPSWEVMDPAKPRKGIVLKYGTGEDCGNGKKRSISYHMICANNFDTVDAPSFVYEAPTCEYHVVWPNRHACPSHSGDGMVEFFKWIFLVLVCLVAYISAGYMYNNNKYGDAGWEAIPHHNQIAMIAEKCKCKRDGSRGPSSARRPIGSGKDDMQSMPMN